MDESVVILLLRTTKQTDIMQASHQVTPPKPVRETLVKTQISGGIPVRGGVWLR